MKNNPLTHSFLFENWDLILSIFLESPSSTVIEHKYKLTKTEAKMTDNKPREKKVKIDKLKLMSDEQLKLRAEEAIKKIESKKNRYVSAHNINMQRLSAYEKYRLEDKAHCLKIISERQNKKALPIGGNVVRG